MRFLFVDRIVQLSPGEMTRGIKHVTKDDAFLSLDEQGRLCFIPSLIGETLGQLAAWNVMFYNDFRMRPVAGVVASVQLHRPAYLGETLLLESFIEKLDDQAVQYNSIAHVNNEPVFTIQGALGPLLPMDDFISQTMIRQQFAEVNRPGDWQETVAQSQTLHQPDLTWANHTPRVQLTFDRVLEIEPAVSILAEKRVSRAAAYLDDHFPHKPVLPLTVLLECKINLAKAFIKQSGFHQPYQFSELRKIKMSEFVQPGDVVMSQAKVKSQSDDELILSFRSTVNDKRVCVAEALFTTRN